MPVYTKNLNYYVYDTSTDGDMTFNVDNALRRNFEIADTSYGTLSAKINYATRAPYCFNSGNADGNAEADLISARKTTTETAESPSQTTKPITAYLNEKKFTSGNLTFTAPQNGYYKVELTGGGGHGLNHINSYNAYSCASGGSGACFKGEVYLTAGNYTITVGGDNGDTVLKNSSDTALITAGAGGNAHMDNLVSATAGTGGTVTIASGVTTRNVTRNVKGNDGTEEKSYRSNYSVAGASSVYLPTTDENYVATGYGAGGNSDENTGKTGNGSVYFEYQKTIPVTPSEQGTITIPGDTEINFKIGGEYRNLVGTTADYQGFSVTGLPTQDISALADGVYNIYVGSDSSVELLKNTLFRQPRTPSGAVGDVWYNTQVFPPTVRICQLANPNDNNDTSTNWLTTYGKIPLGRVEVESGKVKDFATFSYNQNGFNANMQSPVGFASDRIISIYENTSANPDSTVPSIASGTSYIAPDNGFFIAQRYPASSNGYLRMQVVTPTNVFVGFAVDKYSSAMATLCCVVPVKKGDKMTLGYSGTSDYQYLRFVYAEGCY